MHDKHYCRFQLPYREISVLAAWMRENTTQNLFLHCLKGLKSLKVILKKKVFESLGNIQIMYSESGSCDHMGNIMKYFINIQGQKYSQHFDLINSET